MITSESTIKIGVPVSAVIGAITGAYFLAVDTVATKDDVAKLDQRQQESHVEVMILLTELQINPLESTSELTPEQLREYEQLKARLQRLLEAKDEILTR